MGRSPCCENTTGLKRGPWTPEEDQKLISYIQKHGHGSWRSLPEKAGLQRCGKSCRLRWINYLRPDIKRGKFSLQEKNTIIQLHALLGNRWSVIASYIPNRTDNEIKNYWNTHLKKRLAMVGVDPATHKPVSVVAALGSANGAADIKKVTNLIHTTQWESARLEAEARLVRESSKLRQNDQKPDLPTTPPLRLNKRLISASRHGSAAAAAPASAHCLDILKAWQRVQFKSIVLIDNNGSNNINFLQNLPRESSSSANVNNIIASSLQSNDDGFSSACQDLGFGAWNNMGYIDEDMIKGFSDLNFNGCESIDDIFVHANIDKDGNNGSNDGGEISEDDENNNYWDDILNLVD